MVGGASSDTKPTRNVKLQRFGPSFDDSDPTDAVALRINASGRRRRGSGQLVSRSPVPDLLEEAGMNDDHDQIGRIVTRRADTRSRGRGRSRGSSRGGHHEGDTSWHVSLPVEGGPVDDSVIPSFLGHVAYAIQERLPMRNEVIRVHTRHSHATALESCLFAMPDEVQRLLATTGLSHLPSCIHYTIDGALISAFLERWQPDTNTFHLPVGEMSILLHDVLMIMDIPIEGKLVGRELPRDVEWYIRSYLPSMPKYRACSSKMVDYNVLLELLMSDDLDINRRVQGWLTVALGCLLFTDKGSPGFRPCEVVEASDIGTVGDYSWGSSTLAYLYRQLGMSSRAMSAGLSGCLSLLQTWIYEYFPCFRPSLEEPDRKPPLATAWRAQQSQPRSLERLEFFRRRLDELTHDDVTWCPYGDASSYRSLLSNHPHATYRGVIGYRNIIEPHMPERCLRQLGFVQVIPNNIITPDSCYRGPESSDYSVSYSWNALRLEWEASVPFIQLPIHSYIPCSYAWETVPEYREWFRTYCRPYLRGPTKTEGTAVKLVDNIFRSLGPAFKRMGSCSDMVIHDSLRHLQEMERKYKSYGLAITPPPPYEYLDEHESSSSTSPPRRCHVTDQKYWGRTYEKRRKA